MTPDEARDAILAEYGLGEWAWAEPVPDPLPEARAAFAAARLVGPAPAYGSREYLVLPVGDPRRRAAVYRAAELWRHEGRQDVMRARLAAELVDRELEVRRRFREASNAVSCAADWRAIADRPTHDQLERRRQARPAPRRPVDWPDTPVRLPREPLDHWIARVDRARAGGAA